MDEASSLQNLLLYAGLGFGGVFLVSLVLGLGWLFFTGPTRATGLWNFIRQLFKPDRYKGFLFAETRFGGSFFSMYLVVAAVIGVAIYLSAGQYISIANNYASAVGARTSLKKESGQGWHSHTRYIARYSYIVEGQSYTLTQDSENKDMFTPTKTIAYSSADPSVSTLVYRDSFYDDMAEGQIGGVAIFTTIFLVLWYSNLFVAHRRRRQSVYRENKGVSTIPVSDS